MEEGSTDHVDRILQGLNSEDAESG
jgi:hypothetical protein